MMTLRQLIAGGVLALLALPAHAQTWVPTAGGTYAWNQDANWNPATFPNSATATADVNIDIAGDQTIELNQLIDLQALNVGEPNPGESGYTIAAGTGGSLQFNGAATIASRNGANVISAPIALLGNLTVTHAVTSGPQDGSLTLSGPINLNANTLTVAATASSNGLLDRGVVISGQISGTGGLTKTFGNFLVLTGANDYTGPTLIPTGAIRLAGSGTIGSGNLELSGGQFFPGATFTRAVGTGAGEVQLTAGNTGFGTIGQDLTVNLGGAGATVVWGTTEFNPGRLVLASASSDGTVTFVNPIDLNGAVREIRADNGSATIDAVASGVISGTGGLTAGGLGTLELTAANTYTGETLIGSQGTLRVANDAALGATGVGNHTQIAGGSRTNRVELVDGVTVAEAFQIDGRSAGNLATALLGDGPNVTLNGDITFNSGGVEYSVSSSTGSGFTINGAITSPLGGSVTRNLNLQGGGTGTINGVISNASAPIAVTKDGAGTWTLAGTNPHTYAGATTVNAGTLRVNGTLAAGGGAVTVNSGGTFGGTGTVNRAVTVASGGTLAPAAGGAGVLTVADSSGVAVTLASGSALGVRIVGGSPSGTPGGSTDSVTSPTTNNVLRVTAGTVSIDPGINIVVDGTGFVFAQGQQYSYQVGQVDGQDLTTLSITDPARFQFLGFTGDSPSLIGNSSGAMFLTFTPVPEPGSVLLVGALGTLAAAGWRRRRSRRANAPAGA